MTPSLIFNISGKADLSAFKAVSLEASRLTTGFRSFNAMLGTVKNGLASMGVAFSAITVFRSLNDQLQKLDNFNKLSQKSGIKSMETLIALGYAADLSDVSIESLNTALKFFNVELEKSGNGAADTFDEVSKLADVFAAMPDGPTKTALAVSKFGKAGQDMIPLLNQGGAGLKKMREEADKLGLTVSRDATQAVEDFNDSLTKLGKASEGMSRQFLVKAIPGLSTIADQFVDTSQKGGAFLDFVRKLGSFTSDASAGLAMLGEVVKGFWGAKDFRAGAAAIDMNAINRILNEMAFGKPRDDKPTSGAVELATRQDTLKAFLSQQRVMFALNETDKERLDNLKRQLDLIKEQEKELVAPTVGLKSSPFGVVYTKEGLDFAEKSNRLLQDRLAVTREMGEILNRRNLESFSGQLGSQVGGAFGFQFDMSGRISNIAAAARDAASAVTSTLGAAFKSISDNISELILGTVTWGQALANIGRSILTQLVSSIVNFFVQLAARALLTALIGTAITNAAAAAASAAWAGPAVLASIATYGAAAGVGTGAVMSGLASGIPAATAASIVGGKGYAEGGLVRGGEQFVRINERGPEFVLNANAVKFWGTTALSQMNRGQVPSQVAQQPARFIIVDDRMKAADLMRDPRFRSVIVDMAQT